MGAYSSTITIAYDVDPVSATTSYNYIYFSSENTWGYIQNEEAADSASGAFAYWSADVNSDSADSSVYDYLTRSGMVYYLGDNVPESATIDSASLVLGIESMNTGNDAEFASFGIVVTSFEPVDMASTASLGDWKKSRFGAEFGRVAATELTEGSYHTVALNAAAVDWLNGVGRDGNQVGLGVLTNWDFDNTEPSRRTNIGTYIDGGGTAPPGNLNPALVVTYDLPRSPGDLARRRFELPAQPSQFHPPAGRSVRGLNLTLQQAAANSSTLQSQVQDFLNEMPPLIQRNFAITPESKVTAAPATIMVAPDVVEYPLWFKRVGSGNTGWVPLDFAYDYTGVGSAFSAVQVNNQQMR